LQPATKKRLSNKKIPLAGEVEEIKTQTTHATETPDPRFIIIRKK
jgi:hypothetical protein